jgi:trans-aconitate methyltransferase
MAEFDIRNFHERLREINRFDGNLRFGAASFHARTNRSGAGRPSSGGMTREQSLVVTDTGIERYRRNEGQWEDVDHCPVCGAGDRSLFLSRFGLDIHRCGTCGHRYLSPRVKFDAAMRLYGDDKTAADIYTQPMQVETDELKYQYGLDLLAQLQPPSRDRIMDIGCGAGVFLKTANRDGWKQCIGVDVNERYSDIYRDSPGVQFINASFESLAPGRVGNNYDCIAMWSVLEHLYDLHAILASVKALLKPRGLLMILVPNVDSLATRLIRSMSPTFTWKHTSHFSPDSLTRLMEMHRYVRVHLETVITEIDNIKSYMSGEYPYHGHGDPGGLFEFITPEYIHKNLLGSRIIGVFRNA